VEPAYVHNGPSVVGTSWTESNPHRFVIAGFWVEFSPRGADSQSHDELLERLSVSNLVQIEDPGKPLSFETAFALNFQLDLNAAIPLMTDISNESQIIYQSSECELSLDMIPISWKPDYFMHTSYSPE